MKLNHRFLFDNEIIIETPRLLIKTFQISEKTFSDLYEIYSDEENSKGFCSPHLDGYEAFKYYMLRKHKQYTLEEECVYIFLLIEKESQKVIGLRNLIFDNKYLWDGQIELNPLKNVITETAINKSFWKHGFANESSSAIFQYLRNYNFNYILSFITPENKPAIKHIEKLDFKKSNKIEIIEKYGFFYEALNQTFNSEVDQIYILKNI